MWISIKAKEGDTLATIAKHYKNKDPNAILQCTKNKKISASLKKGDPLSKGQIVWVLDPKGKVYNVPTKLGNKCLDEAQYKAYLKNVHQTMDAALFRQSQNHTYAIGRHDAQNEINEKQWFVAAVAGAFNSIDEPKAQRKAATAAFKKLEAAVKGRKYKQFETAVVDCEVRVTTYTNAVLAWIEGLIGSAEASVKTLTVVKEAGIFCGTVAAVTIAAPATLTAGIAVGAASAAGVGLTFDGYEQVGRVIAGGKPMSGAETGKRFLANAATGAAGAAMAGAILKLIKGPFVKLISSNAFIKQQAVRLASKVIPARVFEKELQNVVGKAELEAILSKVAKGGTIHIDTFNKLISRDRVLIEALTKFLVRLGTGAFNKHFASGKIVLGAVSEWVESGPKALLTKDEKPVADAAAKGVIKSGAADQFFDDFVKANMKEFTKELNAVLTAHVTRAAKKIKV